MQPLCTPNTTLIYPSHFILTITLPATAPPYPLCPHACPKYHPRLPFSFHPLNHPFPLPPLHTPCAPIHAPNTTHVYPSHFILPITPFPMPPLHAPYAPMRGLFGCSRKERGREIAKLRFLSPSFVFFLMLSGRREEIGGGTTLSLSIFVCLSVSLSLSPQLCLPLVFSHSCSSTLTRQRVKARERKS